MNATRNTSETWKPIPGWEGYYEVSDQGRVRSVSRTIHKKDGTTQIYKAKVLKSRPSAHGHHYVQLCREGNPKGRLVHRLVMESFVGDCPSDMEVCHNDGNPGNNLLNNLRYDSHSSNAYDSVTHGVHPHSRKTHCKRGHEFNLKNTETMPWRDSIHRRCRACDVAGARHPEVLRKSQQFQELSDQYYAEIIK